MSRAVSPTHITGLFEIRDEHSDILRKGSRGAGVSLELPVLTQVKRSDSVRSSIYINGTPANDARVSKEVALRLVLLAGRSTGLIVRHYLQAPIGSGFGTSGAAALGVAFAGSEALDLGLSDLEAAQLAHSVEVSLLTGLGTVAAEFHGGLELRAEPGAPGFGKVLQIPLEQEYSVVALHNGPMQTSTVLRDPTSRVKINSVGGKLTDELLADMRLETFLRLSQEFTKIVGLSNHELRGVMAAAADQGYKLGMAMFGHTLFTIVRNNEVADVTRLMERKGTMGQVIVAGVAREGAHLI